MLLWEKERDVVIVRQLCSILWVFYCTIRVNVSLCCPVLPCQATVPGQRAEQRVTTQDLFELDLT